MLDKEWLKNVLAQCEQYGYRTSPVDAEGKTKPRKDGQDYKNLSDYVRAERVALILDDVILLDYDGNKADAKDKIMSVAELEQKLDLDLVGMPEPFQINEAGDSIHWLFKIPEGVNRDELASKVAKRKKAVAGSDGNPFPYMDIQWGDRLVVNISPAKTLKILPPQEWEDCPEVIIEELKKNKGYRATDVEDGDDDLLTAVVESEAVQEDELREQLSYVDPCDLEYDGWLEMMTATKVACAGQEYGRGVFKEWSSRSPKHDDYTTDYKWGSFSIHGGITQSTFFYLTNANKIEMVFSELVGAVGSACSSKAIDEICVRIADTNLNTLQVDSLAAMVARQYNEVTGVKATKAAVLKQIKMSKTETKQGDFVDDYVYMSSESKFIHRDTKETMGKEAFNIVHGHETPSDEEGRPLAPSQYCVGKIEVVNKTMYFPKVGEVFSRDGVTYLNEYKPSQLKSVEPKTDLVERIKGHIAHILPDEYEQSLVINYLAHNVQHVGKKIQWCIILQGVQGDGKSLLSEMMQHVLSIDNVRILSPQTLESSSFTGWATGQCMTFIEEMKVGGGARYDVINHMKPYITNEVIEVVRKGKDPMTAVNTTNYMAFTNFKDAMPLDDSDRRHCVLASQWQSKEAIEGFNNKNPNYYSDLYDLLRENAGEVKYWLENLLIPEWFYATKRAPETTAKRAMIQDSMPMGMQLLVDALEDFEAEIMEDDELNISALQRSVEEYSNLDVKYRDFPRTNALSKFLGNLGWEKSSRRRPRNDQHGNKVTFYRKGGGSQVQP